MKEAVTQFLHSARKRRRVRPVSAFTCSRPDSQYRDPWRGQHVRAGGGREARTRW